MGKNPSFAFPIKMIFKLLQIAIPFIWFGLIGGLSFIETPLKFQAPNITLELGLGIGRLVFSALNKFEIALAILLLISFFFVKPREKSAFITFVIILIILILQTVWLLPNLDAKALLVIAGIAPPHSNTHIYYIVFEVVKFILLFVLGISITKNYLRLKDEK